MSLEDMKRVVIETIIKKNTKVVNVKVEFIRPKGNKTFTLRDWMTNCDNVYIGRQGIIFVDKERFPKKSSIWANPFKINEKDDRNAVLLHLWRFKTPILRSALKKYKSIKSIHKGYHLVYGSTLSSLSLGEERYLLLNSSGLSFFSIHFFVRLRILIAELRSRVLNTTFLF